MNYTLHSEPQGTEAWLAGRNTRLNASDLVRAAGTSMNGKTRTDLIRKLATGIEPDVDAETQRRFDDGHRFEALARPIMEQIIGRDLYPITASIAVDGLSRRLGASLDGATDDDSINAEHKGMNAELRDSLSRGIIPPEYHWQMEQGQMVNGATRTLFMASEWEKVPDGEDEEGQVYGIAIDENGYQARYVLVEEKHAWYESNPVLRDRIIPIWKQTEEDAANYQHVEAAPVAVAAPIKDLPAVVLTVSGELAIKTNFDAWGIELRAFIAKIPEKPSTSQEFADCKAAIAAFKKAEAQLDAEESRVLSLVPDVDKMKRDKQLLRDLSSTTRLALEKLVARREIDVKVEIMQEGKDALATHIAWLNKRLAKVQMPPVDADFAAAIKSKRNPELMRDAVSALVANKKIEASAIADRITINLQALHDGARPDGADYTFLFSDFAQLILKAPDDLALVIKMRINEHKGAEAKKLEAIKEAARVEAEANAAAKVKAEVAAEDEFIAGLWREARRIEGNSVGYIQKAIGTFECMAPDWENDPRPRVAAAVADARKEMQGKLSAAKIKAEQEEADRKRIAAGREANAKAREAAMPKVTETIDHGDGIKTIIVEPAAQAPLGVSGGTATPVAAAPTHSGMTGSARLMDRLDDFARQMTEQELSDLCIHAAHILENRKAAA